MSKYHSREVELEDFQGHKAAGFIHNGGPFGMIIAEFQVEVPRRFFKGTKWKALDTSPVFMSERPDDMTAEEYALEILDRLRARIIRGQEESRQMQELWKEES